jgi:hypothetical protein
MKNYWVWFDYNFEDFWYVDAESLDDAIKEAKERFPITVSMSKIMHIRDLSEGYEDYKVHDVILSKDCEFTKLYHEADK